MKKVLKLIANICITAGAICIVGTAGSDDLGRMMFNEMLIHIANGLVMMTLGAILNKIVKVVK